jgi:signal transduction histidine kinase
MLAEILARESLQHRVNDLRDERDLYRALLHMDAGGLQRLAGEADTTTARMRTLLQQPARTPDLFRAKIGALRQEAELIAGSATGARLPGVARRADALQESLRQIEGRAGISGDDLLPIIAGIEQLLLQLAVAYEYVTGERRLAPEVSLPAPADAGAADAAADAGPLATDAPAIPRIAVALQQLADQLAAEHRREVHLTMLGLEAVPDEWNTAVFDMLSQLVRNAIEYGIESPEVRRRRGKPAAGTLLIEFRPRADGGHELKFQDDGGGVDTEAVRQAAIRQHAVDAHATENAPHQRVASLILLPGVTTATEPADRGQGLKIVRDQARRLGGHIKVASKRGRFLRFCIDFDARE